MRRIARLLLKVFPKCAIDKGGISTHFVHFKVNFKENFGRVQQKSFHYRPFKIASIEFN
jgi:hypothetical protein